MRARELLIATLSLLQVVPVLGAETVDRRLSVGYCPRTDEAPVIDGEIDDACWKAGEELTGFVLIDPDAFESQGTFVSSCYDDLFLYLAFRCLESDMAGCLAKQTGFALPWYEDSVEIFLDVGSTHEDVVHIGANYLGACNIPTPKATPSMVMAGGAKAENEWRVEMRIPLEELGVRESLDGRVWGANFCRNRYRPEATEHSTWSRLKGSYHQADQFGQLVFSPTPTVAVRSFDPGWKYHGINVTRVEVENRGQRQEAVTLAVGDGASSATLPPQSKSVIGVSHSLREGENNIDVRLHSADQDFFETVLYIPAEAKPVWAEGIKEIGCFRVGAAKDVCLEELSARAEYLLSTDFQGQVECDWNVRFPDGSQEVVKRTVSLDRAVPDGPDGMIELSLGFKDGNGRTITTLSREIPRRLHAHRRFAESIVSLERRVDAIGELENGDQQRALANTRRKLDSLNAPLATLIDSNVAVLEAVVPEVSDAVEALERGRLPSWGMLHKRYISSIDGSHQDYSLLVPRDPDQNPQSKFALFVWLHGMSQTAGGIPTAQGALRQWPAASMA